MLSDDDRKELKRELFKSAVVSAVFSLFKSRKKQASTIGEKYLFQDLAELAQVTKAQVSRWFNGDQSPNWRLSTFFDMVEALDGEVRLEIVDRRTGEVHTASGITTAYNEEPYSVLQSDPVYPVSEQGQIIEILDYLGAMPITSPRDPVYFAPGDATRATAAA